MTEKDYSGATTSKIGKNAKANSSSKQNINAEIKKSEKRIEETKESVLSEQTIKNYKKAGEIVKKTADFAKQLIKLNMLLNEIAEKIEAKIQELGGEVAFPVNLSINDVAAHYTPTLRDEKRAEGLLKVDIGVHINGFIADYAFSLDLTPEKKHAKLIEASQKALQAGIEIVKLKKSEATLSEIGAAIQKEIQKSGFTPIVNLSGHSLDEYNLHAGLTIPNVDNSSNKELGEGAFAIEPFATLSNGIGLIYDGAGSNIYHLSGKGQVRDNTAREIIDWVLENKKDLPFSQRELERKFGTKALIAISALKRSGIIEEYSQLIEKSHSPVSQTETSLIVHSGKVEILANAD